MKKLADLVGDCALAVVVFWLIDRVIQSLMR